MVAVDYSPAVAEPTPEVRGSSMTELLSGILSDAQTLIRQQMGLIRAEFLEDLRHTRQMAQCFGLGTVLIAVGLVMLLVAGVNLVESLTGWPAWVCWASFGGASMFLGAVSMFVGSRILAKYNPLPDKSFNALQENVSCLTNPQK